MEEKGLEFRATLPRRFLHWIFVTAEGNRCLLGHTFINKTRAAARLVLTVVFTQNGRIDGNGRHAKVMGTGLCPFDREWQKTHH